MTTLLIGLNTLPIFFPKFKKNKKKKRKDNPDIFRGLIQINAMTLHRVVPNTKLIEWEEEEEV